MHNEPSPTNQHGFSLVEIILSTAIFGIVVTSVMGLYFYSEVSLAQGHERNHAILLAQESLEAMKNIRDMGYDNLADGTYSLGNQDGKWALIPAGEEIDKYTREIEIATLDQSTKIITARIGWMKKNGQQEEIEMTTHLSLWTSHSWLDSSLSDFSGGALTNTVATSDSGGDVKLGTIVYADWCSPSDTLTEYDMPGSGIASAITAIPGELFMGTGSNASGLSFINVSVTSTDTPSVNLIGSYDGNKTNDIFGEGNYGYLATDTNSEEVVILNISATPFTKVGYFDAPGNTDANSVFVSGNTGYVAQGNNFRSFNLSAKTGSRTAIGNVALAANASAIYIVGSYAYVALASTSTQMQIINIANPASMSVVGQVQLSGTGAGKDVHVSADGNRAYLATANSATANEFHIIDTSSKTGNRPVIGSTDSGGMSPTGIAVVTDGRAIMGGSGGTEQYQVFNISNEYSPSKCAGLEIPTNVHGIAGINDFDGNAYAYVVTGDTNAELKVIRGGPGGGYGGGYGYPLGGAFESQVFDTGKSSHFHMISWEADVPNNTQLRFQIRSGDTPSLSAIGWSGPDGTVNTYFTVSAADELPENLQNHRYIQYKAAYTSDGIETPILHSARIYYE